VQRLSREGEPWAAALGGDAEAFAVVFDLHRDRVYRHALRLNGNAHDAEDVTAGAFLELWRRRTSVRLVEGSVLPWLLVTTTNLSRNAARSLRRYRAFLASLPRSAPRGSSDQIAFDQVEEGSATEQLRRSLRSLSDMDGALIALTAFEGYSPAQAAVVLGISDGAARVRLHRARAKVAVALGASPGAARTSVVKEQAV
jgi:RNA polymerase sigma factor (sigma-70 family)